MGAEGLSKLVWDTHAQHLPSVSCLPRNRRGPQLTAWKMQLSSQAPATPWVFCGSNKATGGHDLRMMAADINGLAQIHRTGQRRSHIL